MLDVFSKTNVSVWFVYRSCPEPKHEWYFRHTEHRPGKVFLQYFMCDSVGQPVQILTHLIQGSHAYDWGLWLHISYILIVSTSHEKTKNNNVLVCLSVLSDFLFGLFISSLPVALFELSWFESYLFSRRRRTYKVVGRQLCFLRCVQVQLLRQDKGSRAQPEVKIPFIFCI